LEFRRVPISIPFANCVSFQQVRNWALITGKTPKLLTTFGNTLNSGNLYNPES
jgi:hypothetical protein